jgi:hypothetical protein
VGFVLDKMTMGQVFSEYFGVPCQLSFHRLLHTHHLSSGAGTIGQLVADIPSGLSLTPPQETKKKKKTKKKSTTNSSERMKTEQRLVVERQVLETCAACTSC